MKVQVALGRSGNSGEEKDKFPWFDVLDQILGTKPIVDRMDIVESYDASSGVSPANTTTSSYSVDSDGNGEYLHLLFKLTLTEFRCRNIFVATLVHLFGKNLQKPVYLEHKCDHMFLLYSLCLLNYRPIMLVWHF